MAKFIGAVDVIYTIGKNEVMTQNPFMFESDVLNSTVTVPKGFITDFATVPKKLHNIIGPSDTCIREAAVVHDYMYSKLTNVYSRKQADQTLVEGMIVLCAAWWKRNLVYAAVRLFGGSHWNNRLFKKEKK